VHRPLTAGDWRIPRSEQEPFYPIATPVDIVASTATPAFWSRFKASWSIGTRICAS